MNYLDDDDEDGLFGVSLTLNTENRTWEMVGRGNAATLLYFLLDPSPTGLIKKLSDEAMFDRTIMSTDWDD